MELLYCQSRVFEHGLNRFDVVASLHIEGLRFASVGIVSNGVLFASYLLLTTVGLGHKTAMTLLYILGVIQTFIFNKRWTFKHHGVIQKTFFRYVHSYVFGYFLNLLALFILVDYLGYPHQWIQGIMILLFALMLFALQKFWVFSVDTNKAQSNIEIVEMDLSKCGDHS